MAKTGERKKPFGGNKGPSHRRGESVPSSPSGVPSGRGDRKSGKACRGEAYIDHGAEDLTGQDGVLLGQLRQVVEAAGWGGGGGRPISRPLRPSAHPQLNGPKSTVGPVSHPWVSVVRVGGGLCGGVAEDYGPRLGQGSGFRRPLCSPVCAPRQRAAKQRAR